jgi:hypothetical protein
MISSFRLALRAVLSLALTFTPVFAYAGQDMSTHEYMRHNYGSAHVVRQEKECAFLLSPATEAAAADNSLGFKMLAKNVDDLSAELAMLKDEKPEALAGAQLNLTGPAMAEDLNRQLQSDLDSALGELGLRDQIQVVTHYETRRKGLKGLLDRARAFLPQKRDHQRPTRGEVFGALPGTVLAGLTTAVLPAQLYPAPIAASMVLGNMALVFGLSAYQRSVSNWIKRSRSSVTAFMKQAAIGGLFVLNFKMNADLPLVLGSLQAHGVGEVVGGVAREMADMAMSQGTTTVMESLYLWVSFRKGVYRWEAVAVQTPEQAPSVRRGASVLSSLLLWLNGPALTLAMTDTTDVINAGLVHLNAGHLALVALATVSALTSLSASWLAPMARMGEILSYQPGRRIRANIKDWFTRAKDGPPDDGATPDDL